MGRPMFAGAYLIKEKVGRSRTPRNDARRAQLDLLKHAAEDAARETEMLFQLADGNSDWRLTFDEFRNLIDARLSTPTTQAAIEKRDEKLKQWYKTLDANGDGMISTLEYFMFALRECIFRIEVEREDALRSVMTKAGAAKDQTAFCILVFGDTVDKDGDTKINRAQFARLAHRLGFEEEVGEETFDEILVLYLKHLGKHSEAACVAKGEADEDEVARKARRMAIEAAFMFKHVHQQTATLRPLLVEFMASRASSSDASAELEIEPFDAFTIEELKACKGDVHKLLRKLREILRADMQRGESIFRAWDGNGSFAISAGEFGEGLQQLGFEAPKEVIQAIFDELDDDDSFKIGFHEFKTWLYGSDELFEAQLAD